MHFLQRFGIRVFQLTESAYGSDLDGGILVFGMVGDQHHGYGGRFRRCFNLLDYVDAVGVIDIEPAINHHQVERFVSKLFHGVVATVGLRDFAIEVLGEKPFHSRVIGDTISNIENSLHGSPKQKLGLGRTRQGPRQTFAGVTYLLLAYQKTKNGGVRPTRFAGVATLPPAAQALGSYQFGLGLTVLMQALAKLGVADRQNANGQQAGVLGTAGADGQRAHWHTAGHLRDG